MTLPIAPTLSLAVIAFFCWAVICIAIAAGG